ncbi:hypothetical protein BpHYR1_025684 [Brachionus plicatilis]|uniref:Uncharacterized protein n=1 Tax=Brachionus plicatilis TaxID=10195 RepID=A0A3M7SH43_BRAPC|nr:hypothetical protein BpHYR1_025684 [Brachionus plicatilis]
MINTFIIFQVINPIGKITNNYIKFEKKIAPVLLITLFKIINSSSIIKNDDETKFDWLLSNA